MRIWIEHAVSSISSPRQLKPRRDLTGRQLKYNHLE
jgi:hypothetical protein